jgi:hypothetical protein
MAGAHYGAQPHRVRRIGNVRPIRSKCRPERSPLMFAIFRREFGRHKSPNGDTTRCFSVAFLFRLDKKQLASPTIMWDYESCERQRSLTTWERRQPQALARIVTKRKTDRDKFCGAVPALGTALQFLPVSHFRISRLRSTKPSHGALTPGAWSNRSRLIKANQGCQFGLTSRSSLLNNCGLTCYAIFGRSFASTGQTESHPVKPHVFRFDRSICAVSIQSSVPAGPQK